ncbi:porin family protein [Myroides injenensis]|uniref:porin family protein n=1 Tax=Myroides injenensis TaxID=1183151 RepID=UPI00028A22AD|nr:porin family protein [Myroides injenensis]
MKRIITLSLLCLFCNLEGIAQEKSNKNTVFGAKAGYNLSSITSYEDFNVKSGFHIGAVSETFMSSKLALQIELLFSTLGAELETVDYLPNNYTGKFTLNYINIPVMAKYYLTNKFTIHFGPQVGFLVYKKYELDGTKKDINRIINNADFGLNAGLGYEFNNNIFIETRGSFGVTKVLSQDYGNNRNIAFQVSLGYKFR